MNSNAVIASVGLTKVFRDFWQRARVRAVDDLDFRVEPGEIFGLLGPNGSGKSTTIKMVLGLLHPTRGRVTVFNRPPNDVQTKSRIGYLPEESYLYRFLNARETLDYYATLFKIDRKSRRRRIDELLEMVGLKSVARRPVGQFSKGMQRRIGLAQALINDPDLLILDEPTSGLDPVGAKLVKDIIIRLGKEFKKTILLSSHLLADVEAVCNRVTILYGGKVQVEGGMEEVLARRDRVQLSCARLSDDTLREVAELIARKEGQELTIEHPMDRLEALFLRIVEQAHSRREETAGSAMAGDIAEFLGAEESGRAVLEALTRADEPAPTEPVAPEPAEPRVAEEVLASLTTEPDVPKSESPADEAQPSPQQPAAPRSKPSAVDRDVLDSLVEKERDHAEDAEDRSK